MQRRRKAAQTLYGSGSSTTSGILTAAEGAMSAVGAVWSFVANDAAVEAAQNAPEMSSTPQARPADIHVALNVAFKGMLHMRHCN